MDYFNKLPGFIQTPFGLEWVILKKIPLIFLVTGLAPCAIMLRLYLMNDSLNADQLKDIYLCLGVLFSLWFLVGAVAIGCVVVMIMKGPAYVADPYELPVENKALEPNNF